MSHETTGQPDLAGAPAPAEPRPGPPAGGAIRADDEPVTTFRRVIAATRVVQWGTPILSLVIFILIWSAVVAIFSLPDYILPTPLDVLDSMINHWPSLWPEVITTLLETVEGFVAAIVVGVIASLIIASSKIAERLIYPILVTTQAVPKVAIAPIFLAWFGLGDEPRILIAGLLAVFPIIIDTSLGLLGIDAGLLMLARSTGAKRRRVFWQVRLPAAIPGFFAGLKLGVTLAVVGAVVGEFVGGNTGLGYIVINAQGNLNTSLGFAAIVLLAALGVALFYIVDIIERLLVRWS